MARTLLTQTIQKAYQIALVAIEILEALGMTNQAGQMRSRLRQLKGNRPRGRRRHLKR